MLQLIHISVSALKGFATTGGDLHFISLRHSSLKKAVKHVIVCVWASIFVRVCIFVILWGRLKNIIAAHVYSKLHTHTHSSSPLMFSLVSQLPDFRLSVSSLLHNSIISSADDIQTKTEALVQRVSLQLYFSMQHWYSEMCYSQYFGLKHIFKTSLLYGE